MSRAYYNEFDPYAAQWLRNLIAAGHIADGDVDERSIVDVTASEVAGYTQCHFFAGIGVWSHALRSAGWSDDREVWTGSCPCQPFSVASDPHGRLGVDDERHLWPEFFRLIERCHPSVVFGEQVASKAGLGWLDTVSTDLEATDYTIGALDTCAAGFGAPHIRQRLYFVADTCDNRVQGSGTTERPSQVRPWGSFGEANLREIIDGPFVRGSSHPEPLILPLSDGASGWLGRLRAYGNGLCAPQAEGFVRAYLDVREGLR